MRKIIDYSLVVQFTSFGLMDSVKHAMEIGWEPLGACQYECTTDKKVFIQTMVKYENTK